MQKLSCPNCGAIICFEDDSYEVKCDSCKRAFLIEKNIPQNMQIEYKLVPRVVDKHINIQSIIVVSVICIALIIIVPLLNIGKRQVEVSIKREQDSNYTVNGKEFLLSDVSTIDMEKIKDISYSELISKNSSDACLTLKEYSYIGSYLCRYNNKYHIIDIYETIKKTDLGKEFKYYSGAIHHNVGIDNDKLLFNDSCTIIGKNISSISAEYVDAGFLNLKGCFSLEEIYDYIIDELNGEIIDCIGNVYYK